MRTCFSSDTPKEITVHILQSREPNHSQNIYKTQPFPTYIVSIYIERGNAKHNGTAVPNSNTYQLKTRAALIS